MNGTSTLEFVNIHGEHVNTAARARAKRETRDTPAEFHRGWRVVGFAPGALEAAEKAHTANIAEIERDNARRSPSERRKVPMAWDEQHWLRTAKKSAVRPKPYEIRDAAQQCADMATRTGWLGVALVEIKREQKAA